MRILLRDHGQNSRRLRQATLTLLFRSVKAKPQSFVEGAGNAKVLKAGSRRLQYSQVDDNALTKIRGGTIDALHFGHTIVVHGRREWT